MNGLSKIGASVLVLTLTACASPPDIDTRTPYEMEPVTVTVHIVAQEDWLELALGYAAHPWEVRGIARWKEDESGEIVECNIYYRADAPPSKYTFSHEIRHCNEGAFH